MEIMYGAKDFKITYEVDLGIVRQFTTTIKAMNSLDARRRFQRRMVFKVVKVESI
jgi:hypothetical protein